MVKNQALTSFCSHVGIPDNVVEKLLLRWEANLSDSSYDAFFQILSQAFIANSQANGNFAQDDSMTKEGLMTRFVNFHKHAMLNVPANLPTALHGQILRACNLGYRVYINPTVFQGKDCLSVSVDKTSPTEENKDHVIRAQLNVPLNALFGAEVDILTRVVSDLVDRHLTPTDYSTNQ